MSAMMSGFLYFLEETVSILMYPGKILSPHPRLSRTGAVDWLVLEDALKIWFRDCVIVAKPLLFGYERS